MKCEIRDKMYFEEIQKIEEKYYNIIKHFNLNFPKPKNLQKQKKKFFEAVKYGEVYNPIIKYEEKQFDEKKIQELRELKFEMRRDRYNLKAMYNERIKTKLYEIECHKFWGYARSTKYVLKYRGQPSFFLLLKAKHFCRNYKRQKVKFKIISYIDVAKELKKYVYELTGDVIKVNFVEMQSKVNVNPQQKIINVDPTQRFTSLDLKRLKVHEIGTHYMRYFNGRNTYIRMLEGGTSNYIETEEGLATYMEEIEGVSSRAQIFIYAGRVIATYYALSKSFHEVFMILKKYHFKDSDAFAITYRAKRNLNDTSKPGGFTKDYVYFSGYDKVKKFARKHDLKDLFIGKIKIDDWKLLKEYINNNRCLIKTIFNDGLCQEKEEIEE